MVDNQRACPAHEYRIVYTRPSDGGVSIIIPSPDCCVETEMRFVPKGADYHICHVSEIDADRTFRDAWTRNADTISVDMGKARDVWRQRMREARTPLLSDLDIAYQRADEAGDAKSKRDVALQKQALRDITKHPDIDAAQTPDDLKKVWPKELSDKTPNPAL